MTRKMTRNVVVAIVLGVICGLSLHAGLADDPHRLETTARLLHLPADVFIHLVKMVIAPLVLATLVQGVVHAGSQGAVGRIGLRAMAWFLTASLISLSIGLVMVNLFQPGEGLGLVRTGAPGVVETSGLDLGTFVLHAFPTSMVDAMARNAVLQIVVFSIFVGVAIASIGEAARPAVDLVEALAAIMLRVTGFVMLAAPVAVFAGLAATLATHGAGVLGTFARLLAEYYLSLGLLWFVLLAAGAAFIGRDIARLLRHLRVPLLIAFSTASSEAALPRMMEQLDRFGVPRRTYGFVLPLGYSFNLDGSMMSATFTVLFIAQAYGIDVPLATQVTMLLVLMVTSKGVAAVPRASLVVVAATLGQFDLPVEGVAFMLAVDQFMDMGRTATNVLGNGIATAVIDRWESAAPEGAGEPLPETQSAALSQ
ncbi:dicarboxylate/amino acid:cation symporter [Novosphingobium kaempferiae]|uniref:dicarboxylate/amino acid:cation symporter n=1 Tax=Novosphingobium kaempferiae TaxID=2896849 RepID=UPI001E348238|nr:dicarboxylate/amino acid:cation symporter [Novosphingobium kaempferiae]